MAHGGDAARRTAIAIGSPIPDEDVPFQRREWTVQRIGWIAMAMLVIAALLGLAGGGGPLTDATQQTRDDTLQMHYVRVERAQAPAELRFNLTTGNGEHISIWIGNDFLSGVEIESISPQPLETRAGAGRQIFVFPVAGDAETIEATFHYRPQGFGRYAGRAGLVDGEDVAFSQLVVP